MTNSEIIEEKLIQIYNKYLNDICSLSADSSSHSDMEADTNSQSSPYPNIQDDLQHRIDVLFEDYYNNIIRLFNGKSQKSLLSDSPLHSLNRRLAQMNDGEISSDTPINDYLKKQADDNNLFSYNSELGSALTSSSEQPEIETSTIFKSVLQNAVNTSIQSHSSNITNRMINILTAELNANVGDISQIDENTMNILIKHSIDTSIHFSELPNSEYKNDYKTSEELSISLCTLIEKEIKTIRSDIQTKQLHYNQLSNPIRPEFDRLDEINRKAKVITEAFSGLVFESMNRSTTCLINTGNSIIENHPEKIINELYPMPTPPTPPVTQNLFSKDKMDSGLAEERNKYDQELIAYLAALSKYDKLRKAWGLKEQNHEVLRTDLIE